MNSVSGELQGLFNQILVEVPSFQQGLFSFEAKDGSFGPLSYFEGSLRQNAAEENGSWCLKLLPPDSDLTPNVQEWCGENGTYEFLENPEEALENGYQEASEQDAGSVVAEILNKNTSLLIQHLFAGSRESFSDGNALSNGYLEVSVLHQGTTIEIPLDDSSLYLNEGPPSVGARFKSITQVSNAVDVD